MPRVRARRNTAASEGTTSKFPRIQSRAFPSASAPAVFRTTDVFLRTMGISRLSELPVLPEISGGAGLEKIQSAIDKLTKPQETDEISGGETADAPGGEG